MLSATEDAAEAVIWEWKRHRRETRMEAFRIIWAGDGATEALAIGSDIPALLTAALPGEFGSPQVQLVSGFRQFMQLRAEAQNR